MSSPEPTITDISIERKLICGNCVGIEGEGYDMCPIYCTMEELFGGTPDDMFCPFWDNERGTQKPDCAQTCAGYDDSDGECVDGCDHLVQNFDVEPDDFPQLTVDEVLQNGCEDG